jgi:CcmD family protein
MENLGYLFVAYTIIFVAIFLYVLFVWRRQAELEAELRAIEARLRALGDTTAQRSQSATVRSGS